MPPLPMILTSLSELPTLKPRARPVLDMEQFMVSDLNRDGWFSFGACEALLDIDGLA